MNPLAQQYFHRAYNSELILFFLPENLTSFTTSLYNSTIIHKLLSFLKTEEKKSSKLLFFYSLIELFNRGYIKANPM